jgi:hypothetical protein
MKALSSDTTKGDITDLCDPLHLVLAELSARCAFWRLARALTKEKRMMQGWTLTSLAALALICANEALAQQGCPPPGSVRSGNSNQRASVTFANNTNVPLQVYWLDYTGARRFYRLLNPGEDYVQNTYVTHPWIMVGPRGECKGGVLWPRPGMNTHELFSNARHVPVATLS